MDESPVQTDGARSRSTLDRLMDVIKKLSESQQKYLLETVQKWVKDHREYPRKSCQADVIYSDNHRLAQGVILNISAGGLYLQPDSPFAVGQDVILSFEHPFAEKQVKANGKIVRSDQRGIGVKFDEVIGDIL